MEPLFLTLEEIILLHERLVQDFGGTHGVRDQGLLESAAQVPQSGFGGSYLHDSIPAMAAAYLFHLCKNHPFVDGNKRISLMAALTFLKLNGYSIRDDIDESMLEALTVDVASGIRSKEDATEFFTVHSGRMENG